MGFLVVAATFITLCTIMFIQHASAAQQYLSAKKEKLPDRKKIIWICASQIVLYAIQGLFELVHYIQIMNDDEWYCSSRFFYVLANLRSIIQEFCRIIGALIIMVFLRAYRKAFLRILNRIRKVLERIRILKSVRKPSNDTVVSDI